MNKKDESKEEKIIPFRRQREADVDAYTKLEIDKKVTKIKTEFEETIKEFKQEIKDQRNAQLKNLVDTWTERIVEVDERIKKCYPQDKVDIFFDVLKQKTDNMERTVDESNTNFYKLQDFVLEQLVKAGAGKLVDGDFIPKKRLWK